jgi:hypothetical protein
VEVNKNSNLREQQTPLQKAQQLMRISKLEEILSRRDNPNQKPEETILMQKFKELSQSKKRDNKTLEAMAQYLMISNSKEETTKILIRFLNLEPSEERA